jgi:hypothetical protein
VQGRVAVRPTKRLSITASGGVRLWWVEGDPAATSSGLSVFGLGECRQQAGFVSSTNKTAAPINCQLGTYFDPTYVPGGVTPYDANPANRATFTTIDGLGNLNAKYRFGSGDVGFKGMIEAGSRGSREGADVFGEKLWDGGRYATGARASLYGWDDPTRPDRDAISFGYVLGAGFRPSQVANMKLEFEHDMNRLVGMRYRVMGALNLRVPK